MVEHLVTNPMNADELEMVLTWAADEDWNTGFADAAAFHAADPRGFFLTRVEDVPVAAISVVNHDLGNSFLGLYICRPESRGQGIGLATWARGLEHAGGRSVGLDAVPDQEANYRTSGFVRTGASLRHEGRLPGCKSSAVRAVVPGDVEKLIKLDARANGFSRPQFLKTWLSDDVQNRASRVRVADGEIQGFATWRACQVGTKIGPIVAPDTASALELIADIARIRPDGPLIIDLPEANADLRRGLEQAGFTIPFTTSRMYRGAIPDTHQSLQAIATMELG